VNINNQSKSLCDKEKIEFYIEKALGAVPVLSGNLTEPH
jgi:hypothetical protein